MNLKFSLLGFKRNFVSRILKVTLFAGLIPLFAFQLPVEVIGPIGTTQIREFNLSDGSKATGLWIMAHQLTSAGKARIRLNGGGWVALSNTNTEIRGLYKNVGGIGGTIRTIKFNIKMNGFRTGPNTIEFELNKRDGFSLGYRILDMNVLDGNNNYLLDQSVFTEEDPNTWVPPLAGAAEIENGRSLWMIAPLKNPTRNRDIKAKCWDCHTSSGMDLEYFSYSNTSIIEHSKFHGLSEEQGKQIACYIRTLKDANGVKVPRLGRPWNPPYQPGPQLHGKGIEYWAAGAGIKAMLNSDAEMQPYLFPHGTSQGNVNVVINTDADLDVTELPIAIPLPDWNQWLPTDHPKDVWSGGAFENGAPSAAYNEAAQKLGVLFRKNLIESGEATSLLNSVQIDTKKWIALGSNSSSDDWRVGSSTTLKNKNSLYSVEEAKISLAHWMGVKFWELVQENEVEKLSYLYFKKDPGYRQWPMSRRALFEPTPHFLSADYISFSYQTRAQGRYESSSWYQLQMMINSGANDMSITSSPLDWVYQLNHINYMQNEGAPPEGFRYFSSILEMWQTRTNKFGIDMKGFQMRIMHPFWLWSHLNGDETTQNSVNKNDPNLRVKIYNAFLNEWVRKVREFKISDWPRGASNYVTLEPVSYVPKLPNLGKALWNFRPYWADFFYQVIPLFINLGVDCNATNGLVKWTQEIWPRGDWENKWLKGECAAIIPVQDHPQPEPSVFQFNLANRQLRVFQSNFPLRIRLYTFQGEIVVSKTVTSQNTGIFLSHPGVYFLELNDGTTKEIKKIILSD